MVDKPLSLRYQSMCGPNAWAPGCNVMFDGKAYFFAAGLIVWAGYAQGFRGCETADSDAWSAATTYRVGELAFDETTGLASGTETIYNYSNAYGGGVGECHVTYELSGSYVTGVEVFVLSASRTNHSESCPPELLRIEYSKNILRAFQMEHATDGSAVLNSADNGEFLALGFWLPGKAVYKTSEQCTVF